MKILDLLKRESIVLDSDADNIYSAIKQAVAIMDASGNIDNIKEYEKGVFVREGISTTGVGNHIAIPHCQSDAVNAPGLVAMKLKGEVEWDSLDGEPVRLVFLIAAPNTKDNVHVDVLAKLSRMLMHEEFCEELIAADSVDKFIEVIDKYDVEEEEEPQKKTEEGDLILAVTSCPTGVSHTYMGKEALEEAAEKLGVQIKVQTNGSGGAKNILTKDEIARAKTIIVAADAFVDMDPFNGKPVIQCAVAKAINQPEALIKAALSGDAPIHKTSGSDMFQVSDGEGKAHELYKHLMSGISHMVPFVVAGGILLAIAYLIDGICGAPKDGATIDGVAYAFGSVNIAARVFRELGATFGLGLMLPVLGGFIAYSIAGKPGLVSGFVGAFSATKGTYSLLYYMTVATQGVGSEDAIMLAGSSSGFIGAIFAGFIAGYFTRFLLKKMDGVPRTVEGIRDMLLIPFISTAFVGACMFLLNVPFGFINIGLSAGLMVLKEANLVLLLGALVAGLMAIDMGGPINKATHFFVLGLVTAALEPGATSEMQTIAFQLMAANLLGMMVAPIGISFATWVFPQKFTRAERVPALANCFIGCCGITEPSIPYVAASPFVFWASCITGSAVGGLLCVLFGMEAIAPEGGTISFIVMGASCWKGILATFIGAVVNCILIGLLRRDADPKLADLGKWKGIPIGRKYGSSKK
ncbi:MAG: fructose-specific PTS transporter subunit EIIC [Coriobacteriia bacterium]|nr:fructose-specific PTS transporter subunit EIIC [Coriobacteriia bacterium]